MEMLRRAGSGAWWVYVIGALFSQIIDTPLHITTTIGHSAGWTAYTPKQGLRFLDSAHSSFTPADLIPIVAWSALALAVLAVIADMLATRSWTVGTVALGGTAVGALLVQYHVIGDVFGVVLGLEIAFLLVLAGCAVRAAATIPLNRVVGAVPPRAAP